MSTIDQQFVEFIVKSLVGNPDDVKIVRTIDEKGVLLQLEVSGDDLGRVIGKRGATAQSIRTLLRALGTKNDARYNLKIVDPEGDDRPRKPREDREKREDKKPAEKTEEPSEDKSEVAEHVGEEAVESTVEETDVAEEPAAEEPAVEEKAEEEVSFADKHRADLEDLDDLDI